MLSRCFKAKLLLLSLTWSALSTTEAVAAGTAGGRSLLQGSTQINYNPVSIYVDQDPFTVLAIPVTPSLPYSQADYQCNVTGDIRIPVAGATFPLTVKVPQGRLVRVVFANGNLNSQTVTAPGEPGIIVQQPLVQQSSGDTSSGGSNNNGNGSNAGGGPTTGGGSNGSGGGSGAGGVDGSGCSTPPTSPTPDSPTPPSQTTPASSSPPPLTRTTAENIVMNQLGGASPFVQAVGSPVLPTSAPASVQSFQQATPTVPAPPNVPAPAPPVSNPPPFLPPPGFVLPTAEADPGATVTPQNPTSNQSPTPQTGSPVPTAAANPPRPVVMPTTPAPIRQPPLPTCCNPGCCIGSLPSSAEWLNSASPVDLLVGYNPQLYYCLTTAYCPLANCNVESGCRLCCPQLPELSQVPRTPTRAPTPTIQPSARPPPPPPTPTILPPTPCINNSCSPSVSPPPPPPCPSGICFSSSAAPPTPLPTPLPTVPTTPLPAPLPTPISTPCPSGICTSSSASSTPPPTPPSTPLSTPCSGSNCGGVSSLSSLLSSTSSVVPPTPPSPPLQSGGSTSSFSGSQNQLSNPSTTSTTQTSEEPIIPAIGSGGGLRHLLQDTVPGGPNNGLVEYVALASSNTVPGFVIPNTQFGVPYVEFTAGDLAIGQTAAFRGVLEVAQVVNGVPQFPFKPNKQLSPECQININFVVVAPSTAA